MTVQTFNLEFPAALFQRARVQAAGDARELVTFLVESYAQDPHYSQFYANPLYLSPSLAGATDGGRMILNYRNQWPSISTAFSTYSVSIDNFFTQFNSGIGFYLMQDNAGSAGLKTTNAALDNVRREIAKIQSLYSDNDL